ncbi:hypothetical protein STK_20020 [Sulfurisphaera tokodaii str. 7]|uniref:Uncharacterized protein n=1 Tax=Sulfurisphaera tokodaii (strain DSM 16993 / JCM 10545 / NBRC 100140 / 7) TaxID=273063 RepID=Q96Z28_SULTO|nr:hypothetical protein STK_20020 [Sulfurisphaera tokodaii str. 7]
MSSEKIPSIFIGLTVLASAIQYVITSSPFSLLLASLGTIGLISLIIKKKDENKFLLIFIPLLIIDTISGIFIVFALNSPVIFLSMIAISTILILFFNYKIGNK